MAVALTVMSSDPPRSQPTFYTGAASRRAVHSPLRVLERKIHPTSPPEPAVAPQLDTSPEAANESSEEQLRQSDSWI